MNNLEQLTTNFSNLEAKQMNDEFIIGGLDYNAQENTKQSAIKFLNNFMSIKVDKKLISTAYQKGTITMKLIGGKMVKIPKITVVKTTTNVKQCSRT